MKKKQKKDSSSPEKSSTIFLERALSRMGVASRSIAREWITQGRVSVNAQVVYRPNYKCRDEDKIALDGNILEARPPIYLAFNKPRGFVSATKDEHGGETVYDILEAAQKEWLFPVGRLDKDSEGLLFFTNDTEWSRNILSPKKHLPKTYHVQINRQLTEDELTQLRQGMLLGRGERTRPTEVQRIRSGEKNSWIEMKLSEGLNRQIRRMIGAFSAKALRVVRVAIGPVQLGNLKKGESRLLTTEELFAIQQMGSKVRE